MCTPHSRAITINCPRPANSVLNQHSSYNTNTGLSGFGTLFLLTPGSPVRSRDRRLTYIQADTRCHAERFATHKKKLVFVAKTIK